MAITWEEQNAIIRYIIEETGLKAFQVEQTATLLREGATVPFIARYRKEQTGELDEVQIRTIEERFTYFTELEERKGTILNTIGEQGKLTEELRRRIEESRLKTEVEDLYLPYRPKRRTKATIAHERGLEPLADIIAAQELDSGTLEEAALPFVDPAREVPDAAAALARASQDVAASLIVDPYAIEVELRNGHYAPKALREAIRAAGPTVRRDLGKQANGLAPVAAVHAPTEKSHVSL